MIRVTTIKATKSPTSVLVFICKLRKGWALEAGDGTRTRGLLFTREVLYQLSYSGELKALRIACNWAPNAACTASRWQTREIPTRLGPRRPSRPSRSRAARRRPAPPSGSARTGSPATTTTRAARASTGSSTSIARAVPPARLPDLAAARAARPRARQRSTAGLIVAANHRSFLDPFVIGALAAVAAAACTTSPRSSSSRSAGRAGS